MCDDHVPMYTAEMDKAIMAAARADMSMTATEAMLKEEATGGMGYVACPLNPIQHKIPVVYRLNYMTHDIVEKIRDHLMGECETMEGMRNFRPQQTGGGDGS